MLYIAKRERERYLGFEDINKFSCDELREIDQKWLKASNERYGFSVQKRIYLDSGNKLIRNEEEWRKLYDEGKFRKFAEKVGWYNQEQKNMVTYDQLNWNEDISNSRYGHLPTSPSPFIPTSPFWLSPFSLSSLLSRCDL